MWNYKILALNFVIWRVFQCKILTKKGENSWNYWICYIAIICTLWLTTFFQIWQNPPKEKGKIREITESATYYTLWFDEFFQMNKKFLHITGETTPAGNLFAGSADLTQGLSVWTHISQNDQHMFFTCWKKIVKLHNVWLYWFSSQFYPHRR